MRNVSLRLTVEHLVHSWWYCLGKVLVFFLLLWSSTKPTWERRGFISSYISQPIIGEAKAGTEGPRPQRSTACSDCFLIRPRTTKVVLKSGSIHSGLGSPTSILNQVNTPRPV